ncbi:MAG: FAD-dependent oxidoreductase, partial [Pseudomonadota bacterium]|nr:FAD-dependent oxidoreductase [Pseudomonadota bacterium]
AARALAQAGIDDICLLELEDSAGGNSRGHVMGGMRCPLGAHYLPLPGAAAHEVGELLEALGVRRNELGQSRYDERMLCHSPQERLFIGGAWRDGLLPPLDALPAAERARTAAEYVAFGRAVDAASRAGAFAIPTARSRWGPSLEALDAMTFDAWLDDRGLVTPALRWYLDYCCLDDYGAGSAQVSAWAGLHYFASRHGFRAPGDETRGDSGEGVLVWPEGNAWLVERMAAPFAARLQRGRVVLRVDEGRNEVAIDCWNVATAQHERWLAPAVVLATPLFIAARLLAAPPPALLEAARSARQAPWLVANLQLRDALQERPGAPLSWDNVFYAGKGLGYVDAMHQALRPHAGPTVLTAYRALGGDDATALSSGRRQLLQDPWAVWAERVVKELEAAHPDLRDRLERVDLMRYGHAMSVPTPGRRSSPALRALAEDEGRVQFAHSDLSAYSVFEEALYHGMRAGRTAAARLRGG